MSTAELAAYNANYVGGDILGGANDGLQVILRPRISVNPYARSPTPPSESQIDSRAISLRLALRRMPARSTSSMVNGPLSINEISDSVGSVKRFAAEVMTEWVSVVCVMVVHLSAR